MVQNSNKMEFANFLEKIKVFKLESKQLQ
jgi:hypothetical protein